MDIKEVHKKFNEILKKYDLSNSNKADEITNYIMQNKNFTNEDFAKEFEMSNEDAKIFLSFIRKGLDFKEKHLDK